MAEPKKKLTRTRSRKRRASNEHLNSNWGALCGHCHSPIRPHSVCQVCGYYNGEQIIDKSAKQKAKKI